MIPEQIIIQAQTAMNEWISEALERFPQLKGKAVLEAGEVSEERGKCTVPYHLKLNGEIFTTFKLVFSYDWANELDDFYKFLKDEAIRVKREEVKANA